MPPVSLLRVCNNDPSLKTSGFAPNVALGLALRTPNLATRTICRSHGSCPPRYRGVLPRILSRGCEMNSSCQSMRRLLLRPRDQSMTNEQPLLSITSGLAASFGVLAVLGKMTRQTEPLLRCQALIKAHNDFGVCSASSSPPPQWVLAMVPAVALCIRSLIIDEL